MPEEQPPLLLAESLGKRFRYGRRVVDALTDCSFTLHAGEFVAVMGASGSGKSTLLHLMGGLTRPTDGRVVVEGNDIARMRDAELTRFRRRRIGLVFQSLNLIPALNAQENIVAPLQADNAARSAYAVVEEVIERLGLAGCRARRPDEMSGGEQQRVAIARALASNPALILADEPTGNLDSANSQRLCHLLRRLNEEDSRAIVVVTHQPEVALWAHRVVVLKDGQLAGEIPTEGVETPQQLAAEYHELIRHDAPVAELGTGA